MMDRTHVLGVCSVGVDTRSTLDRRSIDTGSTLDRHSIDTRSAFDRQSIDTRSTLWPHMIDRAHVLGVCSARVDIRSTLDRH